VPRNDDGEFELILGNRQLMSVFFIVVILLGVFFAMGYIVGRNSSPVGAPEVASRGSDAKPADTDTSSSSREKAATKEKPAADVPKEAYSPKETASQQGPATKPASAPEPVAAAPVKAPARASASDQPESGRTYLQLSAIDHDKAEIMVELLRKKKFSAIAAEIPEKPGIFRVLVGPISDADIAKTRTALQDASFPGKDAVKRTF
jgi:cell division septation protein DedD